MKFEEVKIALHSLGCKVNSYETESVRESLEKLGFTIVPFEDDTADVYVINTCTVTNIADRKSRQMLHRSKKKNPNALVVAMGCYVQTDEAGVKKDECIDIAIGNNKKGEVVPLIVKAIEEQELANKLSASGSNPSDKNATNMVENSGENSVENSKHRLLNNLELEIDSEYENLTIDRASEHTRSYIKIQDGCNQFCSYCAIPLARGRVRSRKLDDILDEAKRLVASGIKELVLTGIHLCSYGLDFYEQDRKLVSLAEQQMATTEHQEESIAQQVELAKKLVDDAEHIEERGQDYLQDARQDLYRKGYLINVIEQLAKIDGLERIRLGSLEPRMVTKEFAKRLKDTGKVCPHFHLSLQSGCDETLKRMNRHYNSKEFSDRVAILREVFDRPAITTDVIVGFPGETEEEFNACKKFLEEINFYEIHVFQYSPRKGTVAAKMKDQIDPKVKKARSDELLELTSRQKADFEACYAGEKVSVLVEEIIEKGKFATGHTPEYIKVNIPLDKDGYAHIDGEALAVSENDIIEYVLG